MVYGIYETDKRLRQLFIKNPLVHSTITHATIDGLSESETHIKVILALAETNEKQSDLIRKIYETGIVNVMHPPSERKEG